MEELIFLGVLVVLAASIVWLSVRIKNKNHGRKPDHPVYRHGVSRQSKHKLAGQTLVHSHSAKRLQASDDIWRARRIKANEAHWQPGVVVANKILTDSELELEKREPEQGHGMPRFDYSPGTSSNRSSRTAGRKRKSS